MKLTIKGKEIELKNTFRSMIIYEKITGESFTPKGMTEIITYFYSVVLASEKNLELGFEEFIDMLDEDKELLAQFNEWILNINQKNEDIEGDEQKGEEVDPKKS